MESGLKTGLLIGSVGGSRGGAPLSARAGGAECLADPAALAWVLVERKCGTAEVLGGLWVRVLWLPDILLLLVMPRSDDQVQGVVVPTQKLEWVTPKISLMEAGKTMTGFNLSMETNGGVLGPS